MFADFVARILRESWNKGSQRVERPNPTDADRDEAIRGVSAKLQQLAEEIATLNGMNTPATNYNFTEAKHFCPGVADIPALKWYYDELCSAGGADNAASHLTLNGNIRNGVGHKVRGIQFVEGNVLVRKRKPNDPIGPPLPINQPGGGTINLLNSAGGTIGPFSIGRTVGTVTAAVNATNSITLGQGTVSVQKCTKRVTSFLENAIAYNPYRFEIPSGTWVLMGRYWDVAEQDDIYLILAGLGMFGHAYARKNTDEQFTATPGTAETIQFGSQIHSYAPAGVFTWNSSDHDLTISESGLYHVSLMLNALGDSSLTPESGLDIWAEDNAAMITGAYSHRRIEDQDAFTLAFDHAFTAGHKLRFRALFDSRTSAGAMSIYGDGAGYPARFHIHKIRDI